MNKSYSYFAVGFFAAFCVNVDGAEPSGVKAIQGECQAIDGSHWKEVRGQDFAEGHTKSRTSYLVDPEGRVRKIVDESSRYGNSIRGDYWSAQVLAFYFDKKERLLFLEKNVKGSDGPSLEQTYFSPQGKLIALKVSDVWVAASDPRWQGREKEGQELAHGALDQAKGTSQSSKQ